MHAVTVHARRYGTSLWHRDPRTLTLSALVRNVLDLIPLGRRAR
jgi:hypothetical protein